MSEYSFWFFIIYKNGSFAKEEFISTQSQSEEEINKFHSRLLEIEADDCVLNFTVIKGKEIIFCPRKQIF